MFRTPIVDKMSVMAFVSRNLSSSWYNKIPVISVEGTISILQVVFDEMCQVLTQNATQYVPGCVKVKFLAFIGSQGGVWSEKICLN